MQALWKIDPTNELGRGAFSIVFGGTLSGKDVAIKVIEYSKMPPLAQKYMDREVEVMQQLNHPNLVQLHHAEKKSGSLYLVLERLDCELKTYIPTTGLTEDVARAFMVQIAAAMQYLNENSFVHRDLKPQNILLSEKSPSATVKISDFGMARRLGHSETTQSFIGSPEYEAPEILWRIPYSSSADLWSLGCIFFEMLTGKSPCTTLGMRNVQQWQDKVRASASITTFLKRPLISDSAWELIIGLLQNNPDKRFSWTTFFAHKYLSKESLSVSTSLLESSIYIYKPEPTAQPVQPPVALPSASLTVVNVISLTPHGQHRTLVEKQPVSMATIQQKIGAWIPVQAQLLLTNKGEQITETNLEQYVEQRQFPIYVIDQTLFDSKTLQQHPYHFADLPFALGGIETHTDREEFVGKLLSNAKARIANAKTMWEQQESQERVSTVFTTHVQSSLRELKYLTEEIQKKEKVWQELLSRKNDTLQKFSQPFLQTPQKLHEIFSSTPLEQFYQELEQHVPSIESKKLSEIHDAGFKAYNTHRANVLEVSGFARNVKMPECELLDKWYKDYASRVELCLNFYKQNRHPCPDRDNEDKKIIKLQSELEEFSQDLIAKKQKFSTKVMYSVHQIGITCYDRRKLGATRALLDRVEKIAGFLVQAQQFADSYVLGLKELQRRAPFISDLDALVTTCQTTIEQMVRSENTKRSVFRQNANPYLAKVLPALYDDKDSSVPYPVITIPHREIKFQPIPPAPVSPVTTDNIKLRTKVIQDEWEKRIERENATLSETKKQLSQQYDKTKALVPSTTKQYIASLQEKLSIAQKELQILQNAPKNTENIKSLEKNIKDQKSRNAMLQDHIEKEMVVLAQKPKLKQLEAEIEALRRELLNLADPATVKTIEDMEIPPEKARRAVLFCAAVDDPKKRVTAAIEWFLQHNDTETGDQPLDMEALARALKPQTD